MSGITSKYSLFGRLSVAAIVVLLAAGCGDGTKKNTNNGEQSDNNVNEANPPRLITDVSSISFAEVALNTTETETLVISNVGQGDLEIFEMNLVETSTNDAGGEEFRKGDDWVNKANLAPNGDPLQISVEYKPLDKSQDEGHIEIVTNDPNAPGGDGVYEIDVTTSGLNPDIFTRQNVVFPRVPPVGEQTRDKFFEVIEVQNIGEAPLEMNDIVVSPQDSDFSFTIADGLGDDDVSDDSDTWPDQLAANESMFVRVLFNPEDDLPEDADLIFFTNDPDSPEYVVALKGNSGSPCLQLSEEDEVQFGEGGIGYANNKTLVLQNCSPTSDLEVDEISVCTFNDNGQCDSASGIYQLEEDSLPGDLPADQAVISPGETASFVLTYTPTDETVSTGELTIVSNDPARPSDGLKIPVTGRGTDNTCPTALAEGRLQGSSRYVTSPDQINTIPLKTIEFRGTNSDDTEDMTVDRYEWTIIQKPPNSTARLEPGPSSPEPTMFLDLAGIYEIELTVYDSGGLASCEPSTVTIQATPDEDIHVQLVWDTPADGDQTDISGTDLDLHYLHPFGNWNARPHDIFWDNKTADWGAPGPSDDPSLDIDDTDGAGPENVNHTDPESGQTYSVGVYYYADNGFGPSYATVRIYIQGQQKFEYRDKYLAAMHDFWRVATISWPSTSIFAVNTVSQGFPNR